MRIFGMPVREWKNPPKWKASDIVLTDWSCWLPVKVNLAEAIALAEKQRRGWLARAWDWVMRR